MQLISNQSVENQENVQLDQLTLRLQTYSICNIGHVCVKYNIIKLFQKFEEKKSCHTIP